MSHFASRWSTMFGPDSRCAKVVSGGVKLSFQERPKLTKHPVWFASHASMDSLREAVRVMEEKHVIEPVLDTSSPGFYSRLFLVPKRNGENRPVIDLSALNRMLDVPSFRMELSSLSGVLSCRGSG